MSQTKQAEQLAQEVVQKLQNVTNEKTIKKITLEAWEKLLESIPNLNSFKRPSAAFRKIIETAYPSSNEPKPGYYKTSTGKNKETRYEHLSLWYCTTNKDRWSVVGDVARKNYWANLPPLQQPTQPAQPEQPTKPELLKEPKEQSIKTMSLEQLNLDVDTLKVVKHALKHSNMTLPDFLKKACEVYAKTLVGKAKQSEDDLSNVPTKTLLKVQTIEDGKVIRTEYYTHPGRANELVKRAIRAIKKYNKEIATEKSQRWTITQTAVQALTGAKPATIKELLKQYEQEIKEHNEAYNLNPYDNRKGEGRKIETEIDLAALIPSGID